MNIFAPKSGKTMKREQSAQNQRWEKWRTQWKAVPVLNAISHIPFIFSLLGFGLVLFDIGFDQAAEDQDWLDRSLMLLFSLELVFQIFRYVFNTPLFSSKVWFYDAFLSLSLLLTLLVLGKAIQIPLFGTDFWMMFLFVLVFFRELSAEKIQLKATLFNPAQLFILSFLAIIFLGSYALTFPNATTNGIGYLDALFTSTSAVCVTGLSVVDTGTQFTLFGQIVILVLIQLGGLGIMTFTSYFSYFFTGESSYENQFIIQEMTNSGKISDVFQTLKRVLILTFSIEAIGAMFIFNSLNPQLIPDFSDQIFFSVFHAVSSFCNAGFSTLSNSFYDMNYRFNYPLHLTSAGLIVMGGIGFPILFNFINYLKYQIKHLFVRKNHQHQAWLINLNTRLVLVMTAILLIGGTLFFYLFEYNHALSEHGAFGKWVTAFYGAVCPRTAGFNSVNMADLQMTTILLSYFLMWVGASPSSTGGGVKTSSFAIAILNAFGLARGKDKIEIFGRQLSDSSIRRAYAQLVMSILVIFVGVSLVVVTNPQLALHKVIFECISAFGTVGSTLGITTLLNDSGKIIIILLMFIGRVSMLSVLAAVLKQVRYKKYQYPTEDITIN